MLSKCCPHSIPATFKALVYANNKRRDGTYNVKIRVTHKPVVIESVDQYIRQCLAAHPKSEDKRRRGAGPNGQDHIPLAEYRHGPGILVGRYDGQTSRRVYQKDGKTKRWLLPRLCGVYTQVRWRDVARYCHELYGCCQCLWGGSRGADKAEMHIRIEPQIMPLFEKYRDRTGGRLFSFYQRYSRGNNFNWALNEGLKAVDQLLRNMEDFGELDVPEHITFYAARHSWATIARSSALKIDKYTVHEALNHVDSMKITDRYIERDWTTVWDANAAVIGTLDWSELKKREENRK